MGQTKEIPRDEVPGGLGNEGRVTKSRGHSRPHMFGKGGQGTAATLIPAKLSVRSGSDVTERSEESVRLGEQ